MAGLSGEPATGRLRLDRETRYALGALTAAGLLVMAFIFETQIRHRAPLAWDEAARGYAGLQLSRALSHHSARDVIDWVNAQTFYPAMASAPGGIVLFLGASVTASAWVPTLCFLVIGGFAVAFLGRALGLSPTASVGSALVLWTTPVVCKIAAGGFTETLGICVEVAVLIGLVVLVNKPSIRTAILTGAAIGVATTVKYDYGLLCLATAGIAEVARVLTQRNRRAAVTAAVTLGTAFVLSGAQFAFNSTAKIAGASDLISSTSGSAAKRYARAFTSGKAGDFGYYLRALFGNGELGLNKLVAATMVLGVGVAVWRALRDPRWRVPLVFLALWWVMYSLARSKWPRYTATALPVFSVASALAVVSLCAAFANDARRRAVAAVVAGVAVIAFATQASNAATPFGFVAPDPPIEATLKFLRSNLRPSDGPLLFIGPSNELSPQLVRLTWDRATHRENGSVELVQEVPPQDRADTFAATLSRLTPQQVLVVSFTRGARIDTLDTRTTFRSQPTFVRMADGLVKSGRYVVASHLTTDRGRIEVRLLRPAQNADSVTVGAS